MLRDKRCLLNSNVPLPQHLTIGLTYDLDLWPADKHIEKDDLLIKDYLPIKFEASRAKLS